MALARLIKTALDETRMLVVGAQLLLGFELSGVFRDGFESLPMHARYLDGIALLLMIVTVAFLITPESYHQIVDIGTDTGRFHQLISRMAGCALLPFALSLGITLFIIGERIFDFAAGLAASAAGTRSNICGGSRQAIRSGQFPPVSKTMSENTPLDERITQMLTEARVVLPGVQALLGFQLASVISQSFEKLPASSKAIHAASLGCITLAVILLIAPAAYHRIVFSGQETEEVHRLGSWFVTGATIPLAFGLSGDIYVVLAEITASVMIGMLIASFTLVFLIGLWHLLPVVIRARRLRCSGRRERPE
jgi:hypothetical protein